jgi:hypothetical protein
MQKPRATSAGPVNTGLTTSNSLRRDMRSIAYTGPASQLHRARCLDREADAMLFLGFRQRAERLSHQAATLRQSGAT